MDGSFWNKQDGVFFHCSVWSRLTYESNVDVVPSTAISLRRCLWLASVGSQVPTGVWKRDTCLAVCWSSDPFTASCGRCQQGIGNMPSHLTEYELRPSNAVHTQCIFVKIAHIWWFTYCFVESDLLSGYAHPLCCCNPFIVVCVGAGQACCESRAARPVSHSHAQPVLTKVFP